MPYIKKEDRVKFEKMIEACPSIDSKGELEFILYSIAKKYLNNVDRSYKNLHDIAYACHHVGHEIERRFLDKREEEAIKNNGDIE